MTKLLRVDTVRRKKPLCCSRSEGRGVYNLMELPVEKQRELHLSFLDSLDESARRLSARVEEIDLDGSIASFYSVNEWLCSEFDEED